MEKLIIQGRTRLHGEVTISGAKNAALALIPATLLINGVCTLENLPNISDVQIQCEILKDLGAKIVASICIVDRRDENAENPFSWPIFSALRSPTLKFEPTNCPLCDAGEIPLVKPGSRKKI